MSRNAISDEKQRKRQHWAWYFYDFGNSAYAAVILLAVYSAYFKGQVVGGAEGITSVGAWRLEQPCWWLPSFPPSWEPSRTLQLQRNECFSSFQLYPGFLPRCCSSCKKGNVLMGFLFFVLAEIGYRAGRCFTMPCCRKLPHRTKWDRFRAGAGRSARSAGWFACCSSCLPSS